MCAQYLPPTQLQPIYNPNNFPSIKDNISIEDGNALYIQTGTANQSSQGIKTFNDLRAFNFRINSPPFVLGYQPITWADGNGTITSRITPQYNGVNQSFLLPTYGVTTQDTIVAETSNQTLSNKTFNTLKVNASTGTLLKGIVSTIIAIPNHGGPAPYVATLQNPFFNQINNVVITATLQSLFNNAYSDSGMFVQVGTVTAFVINFHVCRPANYNGAGNAANSWGSTEVRLHVDVKLL